MTISEFASMEDLRRLAAVTIRQAVLDYRSKDPILALDAFLWLSCAESDIWFDTAGLEAVNGLLFFTFQTQSRIRNIIRKRGKDE